MVRAKAFLKSKSLTALTNAPHSEILSVNFDFSVTNSKHDQTAMISQHLHCDVVKLFLNVESC